MRYCVEFIDAEKVPGDKLQAAQIALEAACIDLGLSDVRVQFYEAPESSEYGAYMHWNDHHTVYVRAGGSVLEVAYMVLHECRHIWQARRSQFTYEENKTAFEDDAASYGYTMRSKLPLSHLIENRCWML